MTKPTKPDETDAWVARELSPRARCELRMSRTLPETPTSDAARARHHSDQASTIHTTSRPVLEAAIHTKSVEAQCVQTHVQKPELVLHIIHAHVASRAPMLTAWARDWIDSSNPSTTRVPTRSPHCSHTLATHTRLYPTLPY